MKGRCLIVVDMQNDFIAGALGSKEAQSIVKAVKRKIEEIPISFLQKTRMIRIT